ncbi:MAG: Rnase Y domain-containing protein, partial [bacterium]
MPDYTYIAGGLIAAAVIAVWYFIKIKFVNRRIQEAQNQAKLVEETSQKDAERLKKEKLLEAKDKIFKWRMEAEKEI